MPTTKATRTYTAGTPRWSARPPATPPSSFPSVRRTQRRTSACVPGGALDWSVKMAAPPSSAVATVDRHTPRAGEPPVGSPNRRFRAVRSSPGETLMSGPVATAEDRDMTESASSQHDPERAQQAGPLTELRRLRRARDGRVVAGVCAGLGRGLGVDPVVLRVLLAVMV